jgi:hypothetical protein
MQAVGPGSIREIPREDGTETRAYEVIKDLPIAHITEDQLKEAIKVLRITPRMDKKDCRRQRRAAPEGRL